MDIYIRLNFTLFSILYKSRIHILWNIPIYERRTSPADSPGPWVSSPDFARSGPARPVPPSPECRMAGHPDGIPSGVQPFSITQPDYSHEHPAHSAPAAPPPFQPPKCIPLGNIPVFFSQCPKSRQFWGIRKAFFCSIPKISRLFEFFPEKTKIFGYWRKKTAYMPKLRCQNPHPLPQKEKTRKKAARQTRFPVCRAAAPLSLFRFQADPASGPVPRPYLPLAGGPFRIPPHRPGVLFFCRKPPQAVHEKSSCAPWLPVLL